MHFKAAIFDMDGTLIDSLILWDIFWAEFGKRYKQDASFRPSEEIDKAVRTLTLDNATELIHQHFHFGESGRELLEIVYDLMVDFYRTEVLPKPGVLEFLTQLKAEGTKMCIASASAQDMIYIALKRCGLDSFFDKVFSCHDIGTSKNKPDIFLLACEQLGEAIADTWVFEDSCSAIETAKAAGFRTVALYDRNNYGQEKMAQIADYYVAEGETPMKLLAE